MWRGVLVNLEISNMRLKKKKKGIKHTSMMRSALLTEALVSKENLASTSVETFPGMMFKISLPNSTRSMSKVASTCSSRELPCRN